jgi:hypothetical protein
MLINGYLQWLLTEFSQVNTWRDTPRVDKVALNKLWKRNSPLSLGVLGSVGREKLPLPGLSFLCACAKLRCVVQSAVPYERGVRQRGGAGGTADKCWKKEYTSGQGRKEQLCRADQIPLWDLRFSWWRVWRCLSYGMLQWERMMEAVSTSETSVNMYQTARCSIPDDSNLYLQVRYCFLHSFN